jgi:hypothetical protein
VAESLGRRSTKSLGDGGVTTGSEVIAASSSRLIALPPCATA